MSYVVGLLALVAIVTGIYFFRKKKSAAVPVSSPSTTPTQAQLDKRQAVQDARDVARKL